MPSLRNFSIEKHIPAYPLLGDYIVSSEILAPTLTDELYSSNIPKSNIPTIRIPSVEEQISAQKRRKAISSKSYKTERKHDITKEDDKPETNNHLEIKVSMILCPLIIIAILMATGTIHLSDIFIGVDKPIVVVEQKEYFMKYAEKSNDNWKTKYIGSDLASLLEIERKIDASSCSELIILFDQNTQWLLRPYIAQKIIDGNCV